jgi:predicted membrane protein (TIGR00267 family)
VQYLPIFDVKERKSENVSHSNFLSDFILGSQDGLVNVLGILLGVAAATTDVRIIFVAALAALGAESVSMGAVAYTSTLARYKQYIGEQDKEKYEIAHKKDHTKKELQKILSRWGYKGRELVSLTNSLVKNPKAALELLMSFKRKIAPVDRSAPTRSFVTVLSATIFGSIIPIIPFVFLYKDIILGAIGSIVISAITLFLIGYYEAKTTVGSLWRSGLQLLMIGLAAGFVGYLIGHFIGAVPI